MIESIIIITAGDDPDIKLNRLLTRSCLDVQFFKEIWTYFATKPYKALFGAVHLVQSGTVYPHKSGKSKG